MSPTQDVLDYLRKKMADLRGWKNGPTPRYRKAYRRLERIEAYLTRRAARSA